MDADADWGSVRRVSLREVWRGREARGRRAEERAAEQMPDVLRSVPWLMSWRPATREEDAAGIDLVAESDVGDLHVQIKSSKRDADRPIYAERGIGVVVVNRHKSDWEVEAELRECLSALRAERVALPEEEQ